MNRLIGSLFVVFLVLVTAVSAGAQYTVQPGDTGWELARMYYEDATLWQRFVDRNAFLQKEGRVFEKGGKIVLILRPGETLDIEGLSMTAPKALPLSTLLVQNPAPKVQVVEIKSTTPWWAWILYFMAGLFLLAMILMAVGLYREKREEERELNSDPVTSGQPYVPGGIAPTETERLATYFAAQAAETYAYRTGEDSSRVRVQQIGPVQSGLIFGEGEVGYLDYRGYRPRRIPEPGIQAYQARFRFPDGTEQILQSLAGCMNPLRGYAGEVYRGFTFVPTRIVVPAPESTEATTVLPGAEVVTVPTTVSSTEVVRTEDGLVRIEVRQASLDQPAMVRMSGIDDNADMTVEVGNNTFTVRFRPS